MKISITFDCGNDAFNDAGDSTHNSGLEAARILHEIADEIEEDGFKETTRAIDVNGNRVGNWTVSD